MTVYEPSLPEIPEITRSEQHLVTQTVRGEVANFPADGDEPEAELKTIRPEVLQRLCANPSPEWPVRAHGVYMNGATISGDLDMGAAIIPHPLFLHDCSIAGRLILRDARTRSIGLDGTSVQGISADRAVIEGALHLRIKFRATGEVRLLSAVIGGNFDCNGGVFEVKQGNALDANRATVKGSVFLSLDFKATGAVRLVGAEIGGDLNCINGTFEAVDGIALLAQRLTVEGSFFWSPKEVSGVVDLMHAQVGSLSDDSKAWPFLDSPNPEWRLDGFTYGALAPLSPIDSTFRSDWLAANSTIDDGFAPQPYEQLIKVYRGMGHPAEARAIAFAKQEELRKSGNLKPLGWLWN